jgi:hypothetical protein
MTTWKLKLTPPEGPVTEKTGLTTEQALVALADLMYGTAEDFAAAPVPAAEQREERLPLAA